VTLKNYERLHERVLEAESVSERLPSLLDYFSAFVRCERVQVPYECRDIVWNARYSLQRFTHGGSGEPAKFVGVRHRASQKDFSKQMTLPRAIRCRIISIDRRLRCSFQCETDRLRNVLSRNSCHAARESLALPIKADSGPLLWAAGRLFGQPTSPLASWTCYKRGALAVAYSAQRGSLVVRLRGHFAASLTQGARLERV
jgi:hypothetical protein